MMTSWSDRVARQAESSNRPRSAAPHHDAAQRAAGIPGLRRTLGNIALQRLVDRSATADASRRPSPRVPHVDEVHAVPNIRTGIPANLEVTSPGDAHEAEADHVAHRIVSSPRESVVASTSRADVHEDAARLPRGNPDSTLPSSGLLPTTGGRPLDVATRAEFEAHFARDLGDVRIHDDEAASESARAVNAVAYTVGRDIVFRAGRFAPHTAEGRKLLAHELVHVVQQTGGLHQGNERSVDRERLLPAGIAQISRAPAPGESDQKKGAALAAELQKVIDGAVWKEIRKRVYPKESAPGIKRAKERKEKTRPDLTGLGRIRTLESFASSIKALQGKWGPMSAEDRVKAIAKAANAELSAAGIPNFLDVRKAKMEWKGSFRASEWLFTISEELVKAPTLSNADAAELANTALHEARHAEQHFLSARYSSGPPNNKSAPELAVEQGIPDAIAKAAFAAKFDAATDSKVATLGKEMYKGYVTEGAANQKISSDDYTKEMAVAREAAIKSLAALKASATPATIADATTKRATLEAAIAEVEKRYTLYRNISYEADAHEVGDAAQQAFQGWP